MKKCIFILPYFGNLKTYFPLFLKSCGQNPDYQWLLVTDDESPLHYPPNVTVWNISFEEFRRFVQSKFDFKIALETPYKLCDYKPAYGMIFEDQIKEFAYWGHCDCDLLLGRLGIFLSPLMENGYDKLFAAGHMTLYKNTPENNQRFKVPQAGTGKMYKFAFSNDHIFAFDEDYYRYNVHTIFMNENCKIYNTDLAFNLSTEYNHPVRKYYSPADRQWHNEKGRKKLLYWADGKIISCEREGCELAEKEYIYAHLQGRKMKMYGRNLLKASCIQIITDQLREAPGVPRNMKEFGNACRIHRDRTYWIDGLKRVKHRYFGSQFNAHDFNPYLDFQE